MTRLLQAKSSFLRQSQNTANLSSCQRGKEIRSKRCNLRGSIDCSINSKSRCPMCICSGTPMLDHDIQSFRRVKKKWPETSLKSPGREIAGNSAQPRTRFSPRANSSSFFHLPLVKSPPRALQSCPLLCLLLFPTKRFSSTTLSHVGSHTCFASFSLPSTSGDIESPFSPTFLTASSNCASLFL